MKIIKCIVYTIRSSLCWDIFDESGVNSLTAKNSWRKYRYHNFQYKISWHLYLRIDMIVHNHDVTSRCIFTNASFLPPLPKSSEDLSLHVRRLLKIDGRRCERKKTCAGSAHWQIDTNGADGDRISCAFLSSHVPRFAETPTSYTIFIRRPTMIVSASRTKYFKNT